MALRCLIRGAADALREITGSQCDQANENNNAFLHYLTVKLTGTGGLSSNEINMVTIFPAFKASFKPNNIMC